MPMQKSDCNGTSSDESQPVIISMSNSSRVCVSAMSYVLEPGVSKTKNAGCNAGAGDYIPSPEFLGNDMAGPGTHPPLVRVAGRLM